jgi:SHS2 domain-containing protein
MGKIEFLEHTADIKFRVSGKTLAEIFENSAKAISQIYSGEKKIKARKKKKITLSGRDKEALLYNFIEELIFLVDSENFVVSRAKVVLKGNSLSADIAGDDVNNYPDLDHIKSPTYHQMYVRKIQKGWEAQVIVDV